MAKYNAKPINATEYAVFAGSSYFTHTVTTNENDAKIQAAMKTAHWHQAQMDKMEKVLEKLGAFDDGANFGDLMS
jgi:hypothetical protein